MAYDNAKSVRFQEDIELAKVHPDDGISFFNLKYKNGGENISEPSPHSSGRTSFKAKVLSKVFSEDYTRVEKKVLDPRGNTIHIWTKIFLVVSLASLFLDPLFFYLPRVRGQVCIDIGIHLEVGWTIFRSIADVFYLIQILVRFRTAYIAPSSRVFGRGELVIDTYKIALRYLRMNFWIDLIAALPLPQVLIWIIIPNLKGSTITNTKNVLRFIIIFQYIPRLFLIFPLSSQLVKAAGVVSETAWAGAAYNLMLYMLASHVIGACWYLLAIERQESCWRRVCDEEVLCKDAFFDCHKVIDPNRAQWFSSSNVTNLCTPSNSFYTFGIYGEAITFDVTSAAFFNRYFYCLWWGLKNLSSLGQDLSTSTYVGEIMFAIIIATLGLVLFALLIGNMQTYLQSTTVRLEEWRIKRTDTEQWMRHRQLPPELKQSIRKYDQYKWVATRGVDEESLLKDLPMDLRRDIKRHLCYDLVRRVPLFVQMDERMIDAICERLKPALCTEGTYLVREGDPVNEMLFIIRGHLDSYTTNGGRTGFFNSCQIEPGDFCGEELLTWALDPRPGVILPSSTRTVPLFVQMDERMIDAICERLKPALCTEGTYLVREGDPVNEMLFIIRGHLDSYTTNGGRTGFFNSCQIEPGDFCGEELLTWALDPRPGVILPSSTRTVKAISEVEAFALIAEDLKFVASQFRKLHSKQLRHKFRFYSHQWRAWSACFIQAAWRRYKKRKNAIELKAHEDSIFAGSNLVELPRSGSGSVLTVYATKMAASTRMNMATMKRSGSHSGVVSTLQKPTEPDFSVDEE